MNAKEKFEMSEKWQKNKIIVSYKVNGRCGVCFCCEVSVRSVEKTRRSRRWWVNGRCGVEYLITEIAYCSLSSALNSLHEGVLGL